MSPDDEVPDDGDTTANDETDEPAPGDENGAETVSDGDDTDRGDEATTPAGREKTGDEKFCHDCGTAIETDARFCPDCGAPQDDTDADTPAAGGGSGGQTDKDRVTAGVFAILLGGLGVHHFYLGNVGRGVLYLCFFWTGIPALAGLIEGILYLTKTDAEFEAQYVEE